MDELERREQVIISYESKLNVLVHQIEKMPARYEDKITRFVEGYYKQIKKPIILWDKITKKTIALVEDFILGYKTFVMILYPLARYTSPPWNYIWIYLWDKYRYGEGNLLLVHGVHYVTALQGGGKSSLLYHLMEEVRDITGKGSYVNAQLEKARYDEDSKCMIKFHKFFEFPEFFGIDIQVDADGKEKKTYIQKKQFNTHLFSNIVLDEWLAEMNHRMNNTSEYKEIFIPVIKSLSRMRHQYLQRVWIASVLDNTDIQLMGLFKYIHEVEIDLGIDYFQWIKDGMFIDHVKGWHIYSYQYKRNKKKGSTEKVLIKKWYYPRKYSMEHFDSLNQSSTFYGLPVDQIRTTKGVQ